MNIIGWLLDWIFPPKCIFCGALLDDGVVDVCPSCQKEMPWIDSATMPKEVNGFQLSAPLRYEDKVRSCVHHLKFQGGSYLAPAMGRIMAQSASEAFSGDFDLVTWAPVSKKRRRKRGFDQGYLLAKAMCRVWDVKPVACLVKHTDTPAQSSLKDGAARRGNVLGVYGLAQGEDLAGKRILLVDDVCTTGSTLAECVRMLKSGGATSVVCVTFAKTDKDV